MYDYNGKSFAAECNGAGGETGNCTYAGQFLQTFSIFTIATFVYLVYCEVQPEKMSWSAASAHRTSRFMWEMTHMWMLASFMVYGTCLNFILKNGSEVTTHRTWPRHLMCVGLGMGLLALTALKSLHRENPNDHVLPRWARQLINVIVSVAVMCSGLGDMNFPYPGIPVAASLTFVFWASNKIGGLTGHLRSGLSSAAVYAIFRGESAAEGKPAESNDSNSNGIGEIRSRGGYKPPQNIETSTLHRSQDLNS